MAAYILSAVRAAAARCKLPFALCPGLSQEDGKGELATKEITKEKKPSERERQKKGTKEKRSLVLVCGCHERRRRQEQWWLLPGAQFPRGTQLLRLRLPQWLPLPALPELPLRSLFLSRD